MLRWLPLDEMGDARVGLMLGPYLLTAAAWLLMSPDADASGIFTISDIWVRGWQTFVLPTQFFIQFFDGTALARFLELERWQLDGNASEGFAIVFWLISGALFGTIIQNALRRSSFTDKQ